MVLLSYFLKNQISQLTLLGDIYILHNEHCVRLKNQNRGDNLILLENPNLSVQWFTRVNVSKFDVREVIPEI